MIWIGYLCLCALALLVVLLLVAVLRTALMKQPAPYVEQETQFDKKLLDNYGAQFGSLIKIPTVSKNEDDDLSMFYKYHEQLEKVFPLCHKTLEKTVLRGTLLYRWKGTDPSAMPILVMGHQDVVPATDDGWKVPAFSGQVVDGAVYGRGSLDSKCNTFVQLSAIEQLLKQGYTPKCDIYVEASINEETSGDGSPGAVRYLKEKGISLSLVLDEGGTIIEEAMKGLNRPFAVLGITEKGYMDVKITARSAGGHSSTPPSNTTVIRLAKFMTEVNRRKPFKKELLPQVKEMFSQMAPCLGFGMRLLLGNLWLFGPLLKAVMPKISPFGEALLCTTCTFTIMKGSDAANVIPNEAYVVANLRPSVHQNCSESLAVLKKIADKYNLELGVISMRDASPLVSTKTPIYSYLTKSINHCFPGIGVSPYVIMGGTDCRHFYEVTDNAIRFSPIRMNSQQTESCHGINENVYIASLAEGIEFFKYFIKNYEPEKKQA